MQRRILASTAVAAIAAALAIPALASSSGTHKTIHYTESGVGAAISSKQNVYKIHDSVVGNGAFVQTIMGSSSKGGTDRDVAYYKHGSTVSVDSFTFGKPNAHGQLPFTGSGHDISGTGELKGAHAKYTFSGTFDPKTKVVHFTLKGTES